MSLPCSRAMIVTCVDVLRFLSKYNGSIEQMSVECSTSVHNVRRALNALREVLPVQHVRYNEKKERVDYWQMERELQDGEAEAIAVSLFMFPEHARTLLKRARVAGVEPYCP